MVAISISIIKWHVQSHEHLILLNIAQAWEASVYLEVAPKYNKNNKSSFFNSFEIK